MARNMVRLFLSSKRVGWPERYIYTPYMTVHMVISPPEASYLHRVHTDLTNPKKQALGGGAATAVGP